VRGQRHTPAAPYSRGRTRAHCTGGWVGLRAGLDRCGKSCPPAPPTVQPVGIRHTDYKIRTNMKQQVYIRDLMRTAFLVHHETASRPKHFITGNIVPSPSEYEVAEAPEPTWTRLDRQILSPVGNRTTITRMSSPGPEHYTDCINTAPLTILLHAVF
jgi:hypothetical protein